MSMLKLGKPWKKAEVHEDAGEVIDVSVDEPEGHRIGMDKNHRVGKVLSIYNDGVGYRRVLFEIQEWSKDNDGEWYVGTYNLMVGVKRKVFLDVVRQITHGDFVMIGYYVQSFPDSEDKSQFHTLVKLRSIQVLRENMIEAAGKSIWEASNSNPLGYLGKYVQ